MSDNVYDFVTKTPDLSIHNTWIDVVDLGDRLGTLLPITSMYLTNDVLEYKILPLDSAEFFLQSHMLDQLYYCDDIRAMVGQEIKSMNNLTWSVTVDDSNMPCFSTISTFGSGSQQACIVECDILRRNGVVHILDGLMTKTALETLSPTSAPTEPRPTSPPGPSATPSMTPTGPTAAPTPTLAPVRTVTLPPEGGITSFIGAGDHNVFSSAPPVSILLVAAFVIVGGLAQ